MSPGRGLAASPRAAAASTPSASPRLARGSTSTDARLPAACLEMVKQTAAESPGASQQACASASINAALRVASGAAVGAGAASGETGLVEAGWSETGGRGSPGAPPRKRRRRGEAQTSSAGGPEVYLAAGVDAETQEAAPRRSARVAARTVAQHVRSRIVSGFAEERVEDVAADETRRIAEGARRGDARRDEGTRGRMTSFSGEDLDCGAGGAWRAGRR